MEAPEVEIYREAMRVIQSCGQDSNPKEVAFARCSECHARGEMEEATRWANIANAIDLLLTDIHDRMHIPTVLH